MFVDEMHNIFECKPDNTCFRRRENQAYCMANPGKEIAVFCPERENNVDTSGMAEYVNIKWIDIMGCKWFSPSHQEPLSVGLKPRFGPQVP